MMAILEVLSIALSLLPASSKQDDLLRSLVEKLRSDSVAERNDGERELFKRGKAAVGALEKAASDKDSEVASRAKRLIRMIEVRESVPARIRALSPGIEDRLAVEEDDRAWVEALPSVVNFKHRPAIREDSLEVEDADFLIARALRGRRSGGHTSGIAGAAWVLGLRSAIPELVQLLESPDLETGQVARRALVLLQADEAIPALLKLLRSGDQARSAIAQGTLVELGARQARGDLIALLRDPRPHVRANAAAALGELRLREAAGPLVDRLAAADPIDGRACIRALGLLETQVAGPALMMLLEDPAADLASEAAAALGAIGVREAAPLLLKALDEAGAREAAIEALGRLGRAEDATAVARHLGSDNEGVARAAAGALGRLGARSYASALRKLLASGPVAVRREAALALGALRDAASVPALAGALGQDEVREAAFKAIESIGPHEEVRSLAAILESPEKEETVRRAAALLLARQGSAAAWEALLAVARRPRENGELRATAVFSLSGFADERLSAPLTELLGDTDQSVRACAAHALGARGDRAAVPALIARIDDRGEVDDIKAACAGALGVLDDPRIVRPLLRCLDDRQTAHAAAFGLGRQGASEAAPAMLKLLVEGSPWHIPYWARSLKPLDRQAAVDALRGLLTEKDRWRRGAAADGLCVLGSEDGVATLLTEARRNPKISLTSLNALRKPEIWGRLEKRFMPLEFPERRFILDEAIDRMTGLRVERNPWEAPQMRECFGVRRDWTSALDYLNFEEGWVLEEGKIRLLGRGQEFRFWTEWAAGRARKPR